MKSITLNDKMTTAVKNSRKPSKAAIRKATIKFAEDHYDALATGNPNSTTHEPNEQHEHNEQHDFPTRPPCK